MKRVVLAAAVFLALAGAASASSTKATYIRKADRLCKAGNAALAPIQTKLNRANTNSASGIAQTIKLMKSALTIEAKSYGKLVALPKPRADKAVLTHLWATLGTEVSYIKKFIRALNALNATAIRKDTSAINLAKASYRGLAQGFGFHYCGTH